MSIVAKRSPISTTVEHLLIKSSALRPTNLLICTELTIMVYRCACVCIRLT